MYVQVQNQLLPFGKIGDRDANACPACCHQNRQAVFQAEFHSETSDAIDKLRFTVERELVMA